MKTADPYYLLQNEAQTGPFTFSQIRTMWGHGVITGDTLYWQEGEPEWIALFEMRAELESEQALAVIPSRAVTPPPLPVQGRTCLFCAEPIAEAAMKCRHCGEILDPRLRAVEEAKQASALAAAAPRHMPPAIQQSVIVQNVAMVQKQKFSHGMHFIVTLITAGFWLPFWFLFYIFRNRRYYY